MHQGLPFAVRVFNRETAAALEESEGYHDLPGFTDISELLTD
jgi:hypothetical protein